MQKFKYVDRGRNDLLVLLPGWATDYRIFDGCDFDHNYLFPLDLDPEALPDDLAGYLKENNLNKCSVLGWSMGGFAAAKFAIQYPCYIDKLFLASVKGSYDRDSIENIKEMVRKSKKAYLYRFYLDCFSGESPENLKKFKEGLMKEYFETFTQQRLLDGLDYLVSSPLESDKLDPGSTVFIYGKKDKIVPVGEIISLKEKVRGAKFLFLDNAGHLPFLHAFLPKDAGTLL